MESTITIKPKITLFWFRRDLRWYDNHGLFRALTVSKNVVPIFIFDKAILDFLPPNDSRVSFIHDRLSYLTDKRENLKISIYYGHPKEVFKTLIAEHEIDSVYANHDYEPYARERDGKIKLLLEKHNILFRTFKDHVIFEKNEVVKADGTPYVVYTPFMRAWKRNFTHKKLPKYQSELYFRNVSKNFNYKFLSLEEIGFKQSKQHISPYTISDDMIRNYQKTRDFPAIKGTSKLGPHLRFGTVSIRNIVNKTKLEKNETFWNELIWREFFIQILWHFPHTQNRALKPKYDRIPWRNAPVEFEKWCNGNTGYPLVDAGIRELNQTGFMHNRIRMLAASFLCKHLLIDWRLGEAYFALKLLDYEMASNVGNWQWIAGSGADAAPYFRIFNPETQIQKFDKDYKYIKKWVPEFNDARYPSPMVDHRLARERCLRTYKEALLSYG